MKYIALLVLSLLSTLSLGNVNDEVAQDFAEGRGNVRIIQATGAMVATAVRALNDRLLFADAADIKASWQRFGCAEGRLCDLGDHAALSQWLSDLSDRLDALLGPTVMNLLHLSDIKVLNYGLPVVFEPLELTLWCFDHMVANPQDSCKAEYRRHFAGTAWQREDDAYAKWNHEGVASVVSYWVAWGACEAATWGVGWFVICSPIGDLVEIEMARNIAPGLSDSIWNKANVPSVPQ